MQCNFLVFEDVIFFDLWILDSGIPVSVIWGCLVERFITCKHCFDVNVVTFVLLTLHGFFSEQCELGKNRTLVCSCWSQVDQSKVIKGWLNLST